METRERILLGATEHFLTKGVKSTTMTELAQALSVSKKTIYQHFEDKDTLVEHVTKDLLDQDINMITALRENAKNAVEMVLMMTVYMRRMMKQMQPTIIFDLMKYHPRSFAMYRQFKLGHMLKVISENIEQGQKEGYYRTEINAEIVARTRLGCFEIAGNADLFPTTQFDYATVHNEMFDHFLHGLFTTEGRDYFDSLKDKYEDYNQLIQSIIQKLHAYV